MNALPIFSELPVDPPAVTMLQDARRDVRVIFIHSLLDDYGLTPPQFRVYAHLARRAGNGIAWPAVATMADTCKLHPQTVRQALRFLVEQRLITREPRPGTTPIYRLTAPAQWQPLPRVTANPSESDTPVSVSEATPVKPIKDHPSETGRVKGNPVKGNPKKVFQVPHSPPVGECLNGKGSNFVQEEEIYAAYPKQVGKPAALRAIRRALVKHPFAFLLDRVRHYASTYTGSQEFIPNPSTFFRQERFNDDPKTWQKTAARSGRNGGFVPPRKFDAVNYQQPVENF